MLRHVLRRIPRIHSAAFSRTSLITKPLGPVTSCRSFGLTVPHVTENPKSSIMTISALRSCSSLASTKASNQAPPSISSSARPPSQEDEGNWLSIGDLEEDQKQPDAFEGISLERGRTGVFDVEDLVSILRREKVKTPNNPFTLSPIQQSFFSRWTTLLSSQCLLSSNTSTLWSSEQAGPLDR